MSSRLFICIFPVNEKLTHSLSQLLSEARYRLKYIDNTSELMQFIEPNKEKIDCLVFFQQSSFVSSLIHLAEQGTLLPIVIVRDDDSASTSSSSLSPGNSPATEINQLQSFHFHSAEASLKRSQIEQLPSYINLAITKFLHLAPACTLNDRLTQFKTNQEEQQTNFLLLQQRRLAEKLKERLGYLGVYYKRNPKEFYRNLPQEQKQAFLEQFNLDYRQIILHYFAKDQEINPTIDQFVNKAFFADFSVSQILEIHMELMDEFSQQLKLEGRSEEVLLDYRLALIDIIAHLCEMYRRSIPREDIPFDLLFRVD